jgi:hypothetical protein
MVTVRVGGGGSESNNSLKYLFSLYHIRMGTLIVTLLLGAFGGWWWGWITSGLLTGHLPTLTNPPANDNHHHPSQLRSISNLHQISKVSLSSSENKNALRFSAIKQSFPLTDYHHEWLTDDKDVNELWNDSGCQSLREKEQPIPTPEVWNRLRETYEAVVGIQESRIDATKVTSMSSSMIDTELAPSNGFVVPFQVQQAGEKGRGVFAKSNVVNGQLVWSATRFTAVFKTGEQYRTFLQSLPYYECCQAMGFAYAAKSKAEGKHPWIAVDMDEGALLNSGSNGYGKKDYEEDISNLKCISETEEHPKGACFAIRDIKEGEEFLCNYEGFSNGHWFRTLGL